MTAVSITLCFCVCNVLIRTVSNNSLLHLNCASLLGNIYVMCCNSVLTPSKPLDKQLKTNRWVQGGWCTPHLLFSDVSLPTMDTLRHPVQVWPGFDKKLNFLPSANKANAAQVQPLFVCDFWQPSSFRNTALGSKSTIKARHRKLNKFIWSQRDSRGLAPTPTVHEKPKEKLNCCKYPECKADTSLSKNKNTQRTGGLGGRHTMGT